ncbi:MAG: DNA polymerase III subunit epsilon, partial [Candidatus Eremiobacteraeota bacterium]|nr:DNA polymerase III subunit epsilon [Candidatus Eremiobacteraeota bacterium]
MEGSSRPARVVVLDTETTGLSNSSRIVELAALEVEPLSGRVLRRLHHLVNPGMPIPAAATKIHGLRNTDVANKPVFAEIAQELADFVRGATIAAQNATFDRRMLESELLGAGQPSLSDLGVRVVDTVAMSRGLF